MKLVQNTKKEVVHYFNVDSFGCIQTKDYRTKACCNNGSFYCLMGDNKMNALVLHFKYSLFVHLRTRYNINKNFDFESTGFECTG